MTQPEDTTIEDLCAKAASRIIVDRLYPADDDTAFNEVSPASNKELLSGLQALSVAHDTLKQETAKEIRELTKTIQPTINQLMQQNQNQSQQKNNEQDSRNQNQQQNKPRNNQNWNNQKRNNKNWNNRQNNNNRNNNNNNGKRNNNNWQNGRNNQNNRMLNLPNDIVIIAINLDIQLPNVGFAHKIANHLNYLNNNFPTINPNRHFPNRHSLNLRSQHR